MAGESAKELFFKGVESLAQNRMVHALSCFERAMQLENNPQYYSYFAFCIAKERGQVQKAITLCWEAIQKDQRNPAHYLNLGKIYLHAGNKDFAVKVFREGLKYGADQRIIDELNRLGTRKPPVIPFMERDNPINKYLGIILRMLKLR